MLTPVNCHNFNTEHSPAFRSKRVSMGLYSSTQNNDKESIPSPWVSNSKEKSKEVKKPTKPKL